MSYDKTILEEMNAEKDLPHLKPWVYILTGFFFAMLATGALLLIGKQPAGSVVVILPTRTPAPFVVQVSGAVNFPGVYTLPAGSRIEAAIQVAGGYTQNADKDLINQALLLSDGQMVYIPQQGEENPISSKSQEIGSFQGTASDSVININTATVAELEELPGIGETKAQAIVIYREKNGFFSRIEDLLNVPGIGTGIFDQIKTLITIQ